MCMYNVAPCIQPSCVSQGRTRAATAPFTVNHGPRPLSGTGIVTIRMRRRKHKHTRRAVAFYKLNYGFHEPYKVLLDGNFIHAAISMSLADLNKHISNLLGGRVKLYVTRCMTWELQELGGDFTEAYRAAKRCDLHKCGHNKGEETPAGCILEQIGTDNPDRWWVATQDQALRNKLDSVPGCPIIFTTINGIHLHEPHDMDKRTAQQASAQQQALPDHERNTAVLKDLEEIRPKIITKNIFRRNKAKGPNPLSCKKKQTKVVPERGTGKRKTTKPAPAPAADKAAGSNELDAEERKKRKRIRGGGKQQAEGQAAAAE